MHPQSNIAQKWKTSFFVFGCFQRVAAVRAVESVIRNIHAAAIAIHSNLHDCEMMYGCNHHSNDINVKSNNANEKYHEHGCGVNTLFCQN